MLTTFVSSVWISYRSVIDALRNRTASSTVPLPSRARASIVRSPTVRFGDTPLNHYSQYGVATTKNIGSQAPYELCPTQWHAENMMTGVALSRPRDHQLDGFSLLEPYGQIEDSGNDDRDQSP